MKLARWLFCSEQGRMLLWVLMLLCFNSVFLLCYLIVSFSVNESFQHQLLHWFDVIQLPVFIISVFVSRIWARKIGEAYCKRCN